MNQLKHHDLIRSIQSYDETSKRHKLTALGLTMAGKRALGRVGADDSYQKEEQKPDTVAHNPRDLTVDEILMAVPKINQRLVAHRLKVILEDKEVSTQA